jgi:hypothetical protein
MDWWMGICRMAAISLPRKLFTAKPQPPYDIMDTNANCPLLFYSKKNTTTQTKQL